LDGGLIGLVTGFFTAGFLGSWHCGVMCGPLSCYLASRRQLLAYQLGRLVSYVSAGLFAGAIAQFLLQSVGWLKYVVVLGLSSLLIASYLSQNHRLPLPQRLSQFFFKYKSNGFALGLFSVLLPCGWLYGFILSSMAAKSAFAGGLVMFIFWLSTLPALSAAQLFMKKLIVASDLKRQKIASLVLLGASLYSLINFLFH
jgi:uncharacterized protein